MAQLSSALGEFITFTTRVLMTHGHQRPPRQRLLRLLDHTQPEQGTVGSEQSKDEFIIEKREIIPESWMGSKQGIQK